MLCHNIERKDSRARIVTDSVLLKKKTRFGLRSNGKNKKPKTTAGNSVPRVKRYLCVEVRLRRVLSDRY